MLSCLGADTLLTDCVQISPEIALVNIPPSWEGCIQIFAASSPYSAIKHPLEQLVQIRRQSADESDITILELNSWSGQLALQIVAIQARSPVKEVKTTLCSKTFCGFGLSCRSIFSVTRTLLWLLLQARSPTCYN